MSTFWLIIFLYKVHCNSKMEYISTYKINQKSFNYVFRKCNKSFTARTRLAINPADMRFHSPKRCDVSTTNNWYLSCISLVEQYNNFSIVYPKLDCSAKQAVMSIKKKMQSPNPHTALYALLVLESVVKNCGNVTIGMQLHLIN